MEQRPNTASDDDSLKPVALPEDDGQKALRQLLVEIHKMDISEREKAKKMHAVMTEKYNASKEKKKMSQQVYPSQKENPFEVTEEDARPTYHKGSELGCSHYKRGVKLQCSTCHRWHTCRFCHDEAEDHILIRRETKNMLCMHCGKAQPAQQDCRYCGVKSARYYCDKCKLWDDDPEKKIYHCDDCGICRIGAGLGKDFFHCKKCGVCMSIRLQEHHRCIERSTECDCPICGEFMFTSTLTVVFMKCGHSIHHVCYYEHMKSSYRCPTCYRTIINMESQFRALDNEIAHQPLPPPYDSWRCLISCNDCSARSNVPFHFLGLKCDTCRSYNTSQVRLIRPEDSTSGLSPPGSGEHDHMTPTALPPDRAPLLSNPTPSSSNGDSTGTSTLMAATAVIASADDAINMVSETGLIYDDGWDSSEEDEEDTDSWSHCESDHESAPDEQALFTDIDETILEDDDEDEEDDFLALTGHR
ncbi:zinc-ribbon-domain-containing protein [Kalaharituber pfeilii]|nr:zinc-ribbon-domain-containing protein [Kalaharituber pfeilii]